MPRGIVYDNTTLAVAKILGDGTRQRTQSFSELHSHYVVRRSLRTAGEGQRQVSGFILRTFLYMRYKLWVLPPVA